MGYNMKPNMEDVLINVSHNKIKQAEEEKKALMDAIWKAYSNNSDMVGEWSTNKEKQEKLKETLEDIGFKEVKIKEVTSFDLGDEYEEYIVSVQYLRKQIDTQILKEEVGI